MAYIVLIYANIALALLLIASSVLYICKYRNQITWIKAFYVLAGAYWLGIYVAISLCGNACVSDFIRPGLTLTLGVMAAGALYRVLVGYRT
jgi:hypothetical protein